MSPRLQHKKQQCVTITAASLDDEQFLFLGDHPTMIKRPSDCCYNSETPGLGKKRWQRINYKCHFLALLDKTQCQQILRMAINEVTAWFVSQMKSMEIAFNWKLDHRWDEDEEKKWAEKRSPISGNGKYNPFVCLCIAIISLLSMTYLSLLHHFEYLHCKADQS